jgi:hypothetical protein
MQIAAAIVNVERINNARKVVNRPNIAGESMIIDDQLRKNNCGTL